MRLRFALYTLLIGFILSSCGSSKQTISKETGQEIDNLIHYSCQYQGVPYRYGGNSPKGFDCSGYVQYVFKHFNYQLPRTSKDQSQSGKKIKDKELRRGDLVFFTGRNKRNKTPGHVGIVVEVGPNGSFSFIHSSSSKGIVISRISETYYKDRYLFARRIIP